MNKTIKILLGSLGISIGTCFIFKWVEDWKETNRMIERGKILHEETDSLVKQYEEDKKFLVDHNDFLERARMQHEEFMAIMKED